MNLDQLLNQLLTALTSISLLLLISIGLAVIFGMMGIINLAHGEFLMLGAFATLAGVRVGLNIWLAMLLAPLLVGLFGLLVERLLIQFLYGRLADSMLATWGLSLIMVQAVVFIFGTTTQGIPTPLGNFSLGQYSVSWYSVVLILAALLLISVVFWVFKRTRYGLLARAAMQLPEMAMSLGINTRRLNALTFAFGSALAGAGGALLAPITGVVPGMGQAYIGRAFMNVIIAGPGVLTGTTAASGLLGTVEYTASYVSTPFIGQAALLIFAIVLIRFLPTGLSGRWGKQL
ncbi:hypothetical protein [Candidatus Chlorohelix sp.]|uniref:ABC transporter permease subunit n=1 Tax=Candidatus Chlorohelix sp. TaxID=3139201 RepID=UPI00304DA6C8